MNNYFPKSFHALINSAQKALDQGRIDTSLCIIHDFVERIITEPVCASQIFSSYELDKMCMRIGRQNLASLCVKQENLCPFRAGRPRVIYIVSRMQRSGGHSRLVQDFIRAQPEKDHLILLTGIAGPSDADYFSKVFAGNNSVCFMAAPRKDFRSRLSWLQNIMVDCHPDHIYLLNHHQDSVAVAALVPELGLSGSFVHHGDHHLCLGIHLDHLTHIDLHPMGYHYCRDKLDIDNKYLPLTFEDKPAVARQAKFKSDGYLITATAARSNKVEIAYYASYLDVIPQVLKATQGRHIHIGKLTAWALRRMRSQMGKLGVAKDRLIYIEWTPSVWSSLQEYGVNIYIASFPYGAGLTLIEAMGAGVPVVLHRHMYSRVLSGLELAYAEAFNWTEPEELVNYLGALIPENIDFESKLSRIHYEKYHHPDILRSYLRDPTSIQLDIPPLNLVFKPRLDEWAHWTEMQFNFSRLIYRTFYRIFRKLRRLTS